jgi:aminopeptidase N
MKNAQARTTYLKDYLPPNFSIESTALDFDLYEDHATVVARTLFVRNPDGPDPDADSLILHGQDQVLESVVIDNRQLSPDDYVVDDDSLTINDLSSWVADTAARFYLTITSRTEPQNNTALEGLYKSRKMFCTQCEAEGFRRITYYLDRPDVMARFTTTIRADKSKYPVLLSNGNQIDSGVDDHDASRHWVSWEDPFRKPSYLFALVAGDLVSLDDTFTTMSGREIALHIYVEEKDLDKCEHAMTSLKKSMRWDEEKYGREYDLDIFMIVAVDDFNMGAMENKGLNIFNTSCVLANPHTTTDMGFQRVEAVVAHEYFHNWSGNRVTCRDWFQLSLKEGFTVFRDSEFSADMGSRTVKRVEDVNFLKTVQFAEDAGPMAHSVRPDSYMEISNFYTVTIYEKGAEVVRMISLLLGEEKFRAGTDLYFERYDGQAVTTEDFVRAMEDASGVDLQQFRLWYSQAGTPVVKVDTRFDASQGTFTLAFSQRCPDTPGQTGKQPLMIPVRVGLLRADGSELPLRLSGEDEAAAAADRTLVVSEAEQEFVFTGIDEQPVPSLLRGFSAPVRLHYDYTHEDLFFLLVHDSDGFNRWNAGQLLAISVINALQEHRSAGAELEIPALLVDAYGRILDDVIANPEQDKAMIAKLLSLPTESFLIEQAAVADVEAIHEVREFIADQLAHRHHDKFAQVYKDNDSNWEFSVEADAIARRALKNLALSYLLRTGDEDWVQRCHWQFEGASNMTDQMAALRCLVNCPKDTARDLADKALTAFFDNWQHEALVVDQWFAVQATCALPGTLERVRELMEHPHFAIRNPNKVRSLIGAFCGQNHINFHSADGAGYEFLADQVLKLDQLNPQIAARLLTPLTRWKKYDPARQSLMQVQLQRIKASDKLSSDVYEVVQKSSV